MVSMSWEVLGPDQAEVEEAEEGGARLAEEEGAAAAAAVHQAEAEEVEEGGEGTEARLAEEEDGEQTAAAAAVHQAEAEEAEEGGERTEAPSPPKGPAAEATEVPSSSSVPCPAAQAELVQMRTSPKELGLSMSQHPIAENKLCLQPVWAQLDNLEMGHLPGITVGANPKENIMWMAALWDFQAGDYAAGQDWGTSEDLPLHSEHTALSLGHHRLCPGLSCML